MTIKLTLDDKTLSDSISKIICEEFRKDIRDTINDNVRASIELDTLIFNSMNELFKDSFHQSIKHAPPELIQSIKDVFEAEMKEKFIPSLQKYAKENSHEIMRKCLGNFTAYFEYAINDLLRERISKAFLDSKIYTKISETIQGEIDKMEEYIESEDIKHMAIAAIKSFAKENNWDD